MPSSTSLLVISKIFFIFHGGILGHFYAGRVRPGHFEYPSINGHMLVDEAKECAEMAKKVQEKVPMAEMALKESVADTKVKDKDFLAA